MGVIQFNNSYERIMVSIDEDSIEDAKKIMDELQGTGVVIKIGHQLGSYIGWDTAVQFARNYGLKIFLDTKIKDISKTVEMGSRSITRHMPDFFNIMGDVRPENISAALSGIKGAMEDYGLLTAPKLLAVTALTDLSDQQCVDIYGRSREKTVLYFAKQAVSNGVGGIVCSPKEAKALREEEVTKDTIMVTPGIRPTWASTAGQAAFMTPAQAIAAGSDYLVIGSPITNPPPEIGGHLAALKGIVEEINSVEA